MASAAFLGHVTHTNHVTNAFCGVFHNYEALLKKLHSSRALVEQLTQDNSTLRHLTGCLEAEVTELRAGATNTGSSQVREMEERLLAMSEELKASYKSKTQNDQAFIDLHKEANVMRARLEVVEEECQQLRQAKAQLERDRAELKTRLEETEQTCFLLKEEVNARAKEMGEDQKARVELMAENNSLVERMMCLKMKEMETVDQMTQLNETQTKRIRELEARLELASVGDKWVIQELNNAVKQPSTHMVAQPPAAVAHTCIPDEGKEVNFVVYSPDGTLYATGGAGKVVKLWPVNGDAPLKQLHNAAGTLIRASFSEEGDRMVVSGNDPVCYLYNIVQNRLELTLTGHSEKIWGCVFFGDNKVATGSHDRTVRWWDLAAGGKCVRTSLCHSTCNDVTVGVGQCVCSAHFDGAVRLWDSRTHQMSHAIEQAGSSQLTSVTASDNSYELLTASKDGLLKIFDVRTYGELLFLKHTDFGIQLNYSKPCLSPDGRYVAAGSSLRTRTPQLFVWSVGGKLVYTQPLHEGPITCCSWHPDGSELATAGQDGKVLVLR
eukprot:NODE_884_length_1787_cov_52.943373_g828_i0.p1 GENE.NODE_884_length_1787_cov_52.943373_g828_i0~~NODE_884_length_1787_cov_52.943373_g828_i0.p1  ORF type:complete len:550 (-),score=148.68 NODE_884_length_1787_cov_52.943373_g828_i0:55-1704(-)